VRRCVGDWQSPRSRTNRWSKKKGARPRSGQKESSARLLFFLPFFLEPRAWGDRRHDKERFAPEARKEGPSRSRSRRGALAGRPSFERPVSSCRGERIRPRGTDPFRTIRRRPKTAPVRFKMVEGRVGARQQRSSTSREPPDYVGSAPPKVRRPHVVAYDGGQGSVKVLNDVRILDLHFPGLGHTAAAALHNAGERAGNSGSRLPPGTSFPVAGERKGKEQARFPARTSIAGTFDGTHSRFHFLPPGPVQNNEKMRQEGRCSTLVITSTRLT